jgi:NADPH:quinone reductase-like Zn-dependent oxidoreductase
MRHRRIIVTHYGGPEELRVVEEGCPEPKRGEARVRVLAAGVSLPDVMMREGIHPETPALPFTPGWDPVGVVKEIHDLTGEGIDVVFDGIGGTHIWRSRKALRPGGKVVAYGITSSLHGGRLASGRPGRRDRLRGIAIFGVYMMGGWLLPGRKRVVPCSIQWLKRLRPALFRQDLITLFDLLKQQKIKPLIAERFPLAEARQAHELLGKGGVTGKIVLVSSGSR